MATTLEEALAATKDSKGLVTIIAKRLGLSRTQVYNLRKKWATLDSAIEDERESMKDFTEGKLYENISKGKEASIFFYLKTQAKDRGYVERKELAGEDGGPVDIRVIYADDD